MPDTLFLHIGYPKTGTTALQRHAFPALREQGCFYAGLDEPAGHAIASDFGKMVNGGHRAAPPAGIGTQAFISSESVLADCIKNFDSSGRLCPSPVSGLAARTQAAAAQWNAGKVRIIITVRRQGELSHAMYAQSYTHYFRHDAQLDEYPKYAQQLVRGGPLAAAYDFASVIQDFFDTFGQDNVLVLLYEDLRVDAPAFLERLAAFTGYTLPAGLPVENTRLIEGGARISQSASLFDYLSTIVQRKGPDFLKGWGKYLGFLKRVRTHSAVKIPASVELQHQVTRSFHDCNRRLAALMQRDLSSAGYY